VFNDLRWVVVVCFGDIVGIVDHHWLKFFLSTKRQKLNQPQQ